MAGIHNGNELKSTEKILSEKNCTPKLSDAMKQLETSCTTFDNLYLHDLKGWVDRMPNVETNSDLEQTTEKLRKQLSIIHGKTDAIATIRSACNGIASKSRQLDSVLSQPKAAKYLTDQNIK